MNKQKPTILFLDLDGVFFDFIGAAGRLTGHDLSGLDMHDIGKYLNISNQKFWKEIEDAGAQFWADLKPYPWFTELLELCEGTGLDLYISTSPTLDPRCASGKHAAILEHFPKKYHRRFFIGSQKQVFAGPDRILLDDTDKKIKAFKEKGGKTILFPQMWNQNRDYTSERLKFVKKRFAELI